jgi:hypothetical protein
MNETTHNEPGRNESGNNESGNNETTDNETRVERGAEETRHGSNRETMAFAIAVAGWLVPGLGHALLRMWGRAAACFLTVAVLVVLGAGMRGNVFTSRGGDAFDTLGYAADLGTGCFYFAARSLEAGGADVSHANGDYGTRFLATAGVLNLLAALHAFEAARGHKA